ncbi:MULTISPECIES: NAD kinase [unclassified Flavobacterium]|uniref:NAD kinase n=1 Tax=unclassified Flavobacterium TaxID=196869 RepID=UPI0013D2720C|nr:MULTISPECIES: NAD kinase [unclassified Flavobacterium]MBA5792366.1 NAD kinase [Flavobacterium sp. xlx-221]
MKFAIYAQNYKPHYKEIVEKLVRAVQAHNATVIFESDFYQLLKENHVLDFTYETFTSHSDIDDDTSFFVSIGGDGTMLRAANFVKSKNIPIVGVNTGRLGFLANVQQDAIGFLMPLLFSNQYTLSRRTLIKVDEFTEANSNFSVNFALNEITISRKNSTSMITIETHINNEYLATYWADGIIISTPTGSTGYNLSCGGPIITPDSNCLVITPIAPHNLTSRPLIINDRSKIRMKVISREPEFLLSLDSETATIGNESHIEISLANHTVNMVEFPSVTFLKTLRSKLLWGEDKRN